MAAAAKTQKFEEMLDRLQEIADRLEQGSVPLDEALTLYEEGVALAKRCAEKLAVAEAKLKELAKTADGLFEARSIDDNE